MVNHKNQSIARLCELGFQKVGDWHVVHNKLSCRLTQHAHQSNILYAFLAENTVKYFGKSTHTLEQRMSGYRNPGPSQRTNIRNRSKIVDLLNVSQPVEILAYCPNETISFRGYQINLAAGLEDTLLDEFSPEWNLL